MALARLCGALLRRLHRGGRLGRPRRLAVRTGRICHHAAGLCRSVPVGGGGGDRPAHRDQGAGTGELEVNCTRCKAWVTLAALRAQSRRWRKSMFNRMLPLACGLILGVSMMIAAGANA